MHAAAPSHPIPSVEMPMRRLSPEDEDEDDFPLPPAPNHPTPSVPPDSLPNSKRRSAQSMANHVLSEKERRGRVNSALERIRSMIPNSNAKLDKAQLLTTAADYMNDLQSALSLWVKTALSTNKTDDLAKLTTNIDLLVKHRGLVSHVQEEEEEEEEEEKNEQEDKERKKGRKAKCQGSGAPATKKGRFETGLTQPSGAKGGHETDAAAVLLSLHDEAEDKPATTGGLLPPLGLNLASYPNSSLFPPSGMLMMPLPLLSRPGMNGATIPSSSLNPFAGGVKVEGATNTMPLSFTPFPFAMPPGMMMLPMNPSSLPPPPPSTNPKP